MKRVNDITRTRGKVQRDAHRITTRILAKEKDGKDTISGWLSAPFTYRILSPKTVEQLRENVQVYYHATTHVQCNHAVQQLGWKTITKHGPSRDRRTTRFDPHQLHSMLNQTVRDKGDVGEVNGRLRRVDSKYLHPFGHSSGLACPIAYPGSFRYDGWSEILITMGAMMSPVDYKYCGNILDWYALMENHLTEQKGTMNDSVSSGVYGRSKKIWRRAKAQIDSNLVRWYWTRSISKACWDLGVQQLFRQETFFRRIQQYCPQEITDEMLELMLRRYDHYLSAQYYHKGTRDKLSCLFIPPLDVDIVWHSHLLSTRDYQEFCRTWFGKTLQHHVDPKEEEDRPLSATSPGRLDRDYSRDFWNCTLFEGSQVRPMMYGFSPFFGASPPTVSLGSNQSKVSPKKSSGAQDGGGTAIGDPEIGGQTASLLNPLLTLSEASAPSCGSGCGASCSSDCGSGASPCGSAGCSSCGGGGGCGGGCS